MKFLCAWVACLGLVSLSACSDDDDSGGNNNNTDLCAGVTCGTNAQCVPTNGECACDEGYVGDPDTACTPVVTCQTNSCSGHGTCDDTSGVPVCTCDTGYTGDACDSCDSDYDLVGGACVDEQLVDCADITPPANAHQVEGQVTITYTTAGGWTTPADCAFACNTDYDLVGGACVSSQLVDCTVITPPANSTLVSSQVTITYTTAGGWTTPADCAWDCNAGFHREGDACIENITIGWCNVQYPDPGYSQTIKLTETIYGQLWSTSGVGTAASGMLPGVIGQLCYSDTLPTAPVDLSSMTCLDATFNVDVGNNDEYRYDLRIDTPGTYYYVFAFSGDGGDTWAVCDLDGVSTTSVAPGEADITPVIPNGGLEEWDVTDATPLYWTPDSGVGVAKETAIVRTGSASVRLTRNSATNADTDFVSAFGPVAAGIDYTISLWFYDDDPNGRGRIIYQWFDDTFTSIAAATYGAYTSDSTSWQNLTANATAPANAAYIVVSTRIYTQTGGTSTGGYVFLDDVSVY